MTLLVSGHILLPSTVRCPRLTLDPPRSRPWPATFPSGGERYLEAKVWVLCMLISLVSLFLQLFNGQKFKYVFFKHHEFIQTMPSPPTQHQGAHPHSPMPLVGLPPPTARIWASDICIVTRAKAYA